jgi:hypothetical protein
VQKREALLKKIAGLEAGIKVLSNVSKQSYDLFQLWSWICEL